MKDLFILCTFLSLLLRGKDFSLHFQTGIVTTSRFYLPQKYQKKEKARNCFLQPYGCFFSSRQSLHSDTRYRSWTLHARGVRCGCCVIVDNTH